MMKNINNEKGITLIALIITVIITVILAVIVISSLTGDNSIVKNAENAKNMTEVTEKEENETVKNLFGHITNINIGGSGGGNGGTGDNTGHTHIWSSGVVTKNPTCTSIGTKLYSCTVSGCTQTKNENIAIDPNAHSYTTTITKTATCTEAGTQTKKCVYCGYNYDDAIPALGGSHEWLSEGYFATCTYEHVEVICCEKCGEVALGMLNGQHENDGLGDCSWCGAAIWDDIEYNNYYESGLTFSEYMHKYLDGHIFYYPLNGVNTCLGCAYADGTLEYINYR